MGKGGRRRIGRACLAALVLIGSVAWLARDGPPAERSLATADAARGGVIWMPD